MQWLPDSASAVVAKSAAAYLWMDFKVCFVGNLNGNSNIVYFINSLVIISTICNDSFDGSMDALALWPKI